MFITNDECNKYDVNIWFKKKDNLNKAIVLWR
jgi:hypothetical protein